MKRADQIVGAALFLVWAVMFFQASRLEMVYRGAPGSGFFPLWLSIGGMLISAGIVANGTIRPAVRDRSVSWPGGAGLRRILITLALFLVYALVLIRLLGYILSTGLLVTLLAWVLGARHRLQVLGVGVGVSVGMYVVFHVWLQMSLPRGLLIIP